MCYDASVGRSIHKVADTETERLLLRILPKRTAATMYVWMCYVPKIVDGFFLVVCCNAHDHLVWTHSGPKVASSLAGAVANMRSGSEDRLVLSCDFDGCPIRRSAAHYLFSVGVGTSPTEE